MIERSRSDDDRFIRRVVESVDGRTFVLGTTSYCVRVESVYPEFNERRRRLHEVTLEILATPQVAPERAIQISFTFSPRRSHETQLALFENFLRGDVARLAGEAVQKQVHRSPIPLESDLLWGLRGATAVLTAFRMTASNLAVSSLPWISTILTSGLCAVAVCWVYLEWQRWLEAHSAG